MHTHTHSEEHVSTTLHSVFSARATLPRHTISSLSVWKPSLYPPEYVISKPPSIDLPLMSRSEGEQKERRAPKSDIKIVFSSGV